MSFDPTVIFTGPDIPDVVSLAPVKPVGPARVKPGEAIDISKGIKPDLADLIRQAIYGLPDDKKKIVYHNKIDYSIYAANMYRNKEQRATDLKQFTRRAKYIAEDSNDESGLYKLNDGSFVIAMRGSKTAADWLITDASILQGNIQSSPRFKRSNQYVKNMVKKYNIDPSKLTLVGHSLSGNLCHAINSQNNGQFRSIGFNSGYSPLAIDFDPNLKSGKYLGDNYLNMSVIGDPITASGSFLPNGVRNVFVPAKGVNPVSRHSIDNFIKQIGDYRNREDGDIYGSTFDKTENDENDENDKQWSEMPTYNYREDPGEDRDRPIDYPPLLPVIVGGEEMPIGEPIGDEPVLDLGGEPEAIQMEDIFGSIVEGEEDLLGILPEIDIAGSVGGGLESLGVSTEVAAGVGEAVEIISLGGFL